METLSRFIYCSQIRPEYDISVVADIVKVARDFNKAHGITGILIFDGQRFCQYIEGPTENLNLLIQRLTQDPRHINFTPKYSAESGKDRLFTNWSMAYVLVDDDEPLNEMEALEGNSTLEKLHSLIPMLDIA